MTFWSGETLAAKAPTLIAPYRADAIDCSAYTLHIGPEVFVTADQSGGTKDGVKTVLAPDEPFKIPPGQFAFLLTDETVSVPVDAIAFISFKTAQKWLGLVNVSGFHVDPGWKGTLMFGLYNAGPNPVHLCRGMPMFLIWYASLDRPTGMTYRMTGDKGQPHIPEKYINNMAGQVFSPMNLAKELQSMKERMTADHVTMSGRLHQLEAGQRWTQRFLYASLVALFGLLFGPSIIKLASSWSGQETAPANGHEPATVSPPQEPAPVPVRQEPSRPAAQSNQVDDKASDAANQEPRTR